MHRSSNGLLLLALIFSFCATAPLLAQASQNASQPSSQAQNQQQQPGQQQPVHDLTPPSDAEAERAAQPAPAPAPNQPTDSTKVPTQPQPRQNPNDPYLFRKDVEEVMLYATVVDPKNRAVTNLDKNSFSVYEDGQPQQITSFRREDIPVSMGILIDNSGSMRDKRPAVNQAALNLVRASNPQDEVFIVNFNDDAFLDQDFTSNIELMREALERIDARGGTAIYDSVIASANQLAKGAKRDKKVLLLVTDGEDNASRDTLEEAVKRVQDDAGPTVYTIGVLGNDREAKRARRALERLTAETGGIAYFPKDLGEVDAISRAVAHDIRNQYTIGYKPTRPQSQGGFRNVRVEARGADGRSKLQVRTRSGYFAGQKRAAAQ
ncbi:MAG: von Willebrand factor, type [Candidatus Angelobacter sp.]|nr:von Willebrand factor, type [Candidatus Angelobacter sp.]